jgi:hypothetical protein
MVKTLMAEERTPARCGRRWLGGLRKFRTNEYVIFISLAEKTELWNRELPELYKSSLLKFHADVKVSELKCEQRQVSRRNPRSQNLKN